MKKYRLVLDIVILMVCTFVYMSYHIGRFLLGPDQILQYATAEQLSVGNGITLPAVNYQDVSIPEFIAHNEFAPGLAVLASPLFMISDNYRVINFILVIVLDAIFLLLTILLLIRLLRRNLKLNEITLIVSFFTIAYSLLLRECISDMICLNCFVLSVILMMKYIEDKKLIFLVLCCLLVSLTTYFRYAYLAALLVIPCFFIYRIVFNNTKEFKELVLSICIMSIFSSVFLGHILYLNSQTGYVSSQSSVKGLYLENIVQSNPFPMNSFFDHNIVLKIMGYSSDNIDRGYIYPNWIHFCFYAISLVLLMPVFYLFWLKRKGSKIKEFGEMYYMLIFSLGLLGLVVIASVINPSQNVDYIWSWAQVGRYYMTPCYCIIICYFICIFKGERYSKYVKWFCLSIIGASLLFNASLMGRNYYVNYKPFDVYHNMSIMRPNNSLCNSYDLNKYFSSIEGYKVVLIDDFYKDKLYKANMFLNLANTSAIYSDNPNIMTLNTSNPYDVYIITGEDMSDEIKTVFNKYDVIKVCDLNDNIRIYKYTLTKND